MALPRIVLFLVIATALVGAQTDNPSFDAAAVTANHSGGKKGAIRSRPGGRFTATNVTLRDLMEAAYPLGQSDPLVGAPARLTVDRFDVIAKAPGNTDDNIRAAIKGGGAKEKIGARESGQPSAEQLMLRALLQDRFKLALHEETRDQPVWRVRRSTDGGIAGAQAAVHDRR